MLVRNALIAGLITVGASLHAASVDAPTANRWDPVAAALNSGDPQASALLDAIVKDFPKWDHGLMKRAGYLESAGDLERALSDAKQALKLSPDKADAISLTMRLQNRLARHSASLDLFAKHRKHADPGGWIHYLAAEAATALDQNGAALEYLDRAVSKAGSAVPIEFRLLQADVAHKKGDIGAAIANYERALTTAKDSHPGSWFNLGALQRLQAAGDRVGLKRAVESFRTVVRIDGDDAVAWFALGQVLVDIEEFSRAQEALNTALDRFRKAGIDSGTELASTEAAFGLAHLRLAEADSPAGDYGEALIHLERAEALGQRSAALYNNTLAAIIGAQRTAGEAERAELQAKAQALVDGEGGAYISAINLAMNYYGDGSSKLGSDPEKAGAAGRMAAELFQRGLDSGETDDARSVQRFLGHAHALVADSASAAGDDAARTAALDAARDAYVAASQAGDKTAQRHYLARESTRGANATYAAGWRYLGWNTYLSADGWQAVLSTYGTSGAWKNPIHIAVWSVLIVGMLVLGIRGLLGGGSASEPVERTARKQARDQESRERGTDRHAGTATRTRQPERPAKRAPAAASTQQAPAKPRQAPAAQTRRAVGDVAKRMASSRAEQEPQTASRRRPPPRRRR